MTTIRVAASLFIFFLIALSVLGWIWNGTHQAAGQAVAGQVVLTLGALAGLAGLAALWRWPPRA